MTFPITYECLLFDFLAFFYGDRWPSRSDIEDMRPHFPIVICDHFTSKSKGLGHSC